MLNLILGNDLDDLRFGSIGQSLVYGDKIDKLSNNIQVKSTAFDHGNCKLVLYKRSNPGGRFEAGVIFEPSPGFKKEKILPKEMLRLFSMDEDVCFDLAEKYYIDLAVEQKFRCQN